MSNLHQLIAESIKKADRRYFFEDYNAQAKAVMKALEKDGYKIVPSTPTEQQIDAGKAVVSAGRVRPSDLMQMIYRAMVQAVR